MVKKLRGLAKTLRKNVTDAENYMWLFLRNRQIEGVKFRRQETIGSYIVDFVSHERKLIIELDGGQHALSVEKDGKRSKWFNEHGYEVLRFWNNEVLQNKDGVLEAVRQKLLTPHLSSSPSRGEE